MNKKKAQHFLFIIVIIMAIIVKIKLVYLIIFKGYILINCSYYSIIVFFIIFEFKLFKRLTVLLIDIAGFLSK